MNPEPVFMFSTQRAIAVDKFVFLFLSNDFLRINKVTFIRITVPIGEKIALKGSGLFESNQTGIFQYDG